MRVLLLLWCLAAPCLAEPFTELHFETIPQGCTVLLVDSGGAVLAGGETGAIALDRKLLEQAGDPLTFRLLKAGFSPAVVEIPRQDVESPRMRWPRSSLEFLRLRPQLVRAVFRSAPAGAEIWLLKAGREEYLGLTGETLRLNLAQLVGDTAASGYFELRLKLQGYHPQVVQVPNHALLAQRDTVWPAEGPYSLRPEIPVLVPLYSLAREHPVLLATAATLALALWFGWLLPAWRARRLQLARAERIEFSLAGGGETDLSGRRLGPYRLGASLGAGGMATVYRALPDDTLDASQTCAVKVMRLDREETRKFAAEVKILMALHHPGILRLDDWGEQNGLVYLVTELVEGRNLRDWMLDRGPLPRDRFLEVMLPLCRAVAFAHSQGVVHGDLKPENVLVDGRGTLKVADFGLARAAFVDSRRTELHGTPGYIAPELYQGGDLTPASDQFALGVIGFELSTGRRPEPTDEPAGDPLLAVLARMRSPDPAERFANLDEVIAALER